MVVVCQLGRGSAQLCCHRSHLQFIVAVSHEKLVPAHWGDVACHLCNLHDAGNTCSRRHQRVIHTSSIKEADKDLSGHGGR